MSTDAASQHTYDVLDEVWQERQRQERKFGVQTHPDGTLLAHSHKRADAARSICDLATMLGKVTWAHILTEEYFEALDESDPEKLRAELLQVAAVAVNWVEDIDRRATS